MQERDAASDFTFDRLGRMTQLTHSQARNQEIQTVYISAVYISALPIFGKLAKFVGAGGDLTKWNSEKPHQRPETG